MIDDEMPVPPTFICYLEDEELKVFQSYPTLHEAEKALEKLNDRIVKSPYFIAGPGVVPRLTMASFFKIDMFSDKDFLVTNINWSESQDGATVQIDGIEMGENNIYK
jgi:hypothetical protein